MLPLLPKEKSNSKAVSARGRRAGGSVGGGRRPLSVRAKPGEVVGCPRQEFEERGMRIG